MFNSDKFNDDDDDDDEEEGEGEEEEEEEGGCDGGLYGYSNTYVRPLVGMRHWSVGFGWC